MGPLSHNRVPDLGFCRVARVCATVCHCATLSDMSRMLSVRLDEDLYDLLVAQAQAESRSLSNYVVVLLKGGAKLMARDLGPDVAQRHTQEVWEGTPGPVPNPVQQKRVMKRATPVTDDEKRAAILAKYQ